MSDTKGPYRVTKADLDDWYIVQGPTMVFGSHGWMTLSEASMLSDRLNAAYAAGQKSDAKLIQILVDAAKSAHHHFQNLLDYGVVLGPDRDKVRCEQFNLRIALSLAKPKGYRPTT